MRRLLLLTLLCTPAAGEDALPAGADTKQLAEYLLTSWRAEREKLRCGVFVFSAQLSSTDGAGLPAGESPSALVQVDSIRTQFDFDRGMAELSFSANGEVCSYFGMLPDQQIEWGSGLVATIRPPVDRSIEAGRVIIDPRIFGFANSTRLEEGCSLEWAWRYLYGQLRSLESVSHDPNSSEYFLKYRYKAPPESQGVSMVETVVIDEDRGFVITRRTREAETPEGTTVPAIQVDTEWSERSGVWVPVAARLVEPMGHMIGAVTLDWQSVNECSESWNVSVEASPIPDDALVADQRSASGASITLGRLSELRHPPRHVTPLRDSGFSGKTKIVWIANLVVLIAVGMYWGWSNRSKGRMDRR